MSNDNLKSQSPAGDRPAAACSAIRIGDRVFVLSRQTRRERMANEPIMGTVVALGKWGVGFVVRKDGQKSTIKLQRHDIAPAPQIIDGEVAVRGKPPEFAAAMVRMLKRASFDLVTGNLGPDDDFQTMPNVKAHPRREEKPEFQERRYPPLDGASC